MEVEEIQCLIPKAGKGISGDMWDYAAMGLEVATNFTNIVPGLGAAITGFRDHGVLGGVVGLGAGYAATMAGAYGMGYLLAAVGLAGTAAFAPLALVGAGVIGAFGGKAVTNGIFELIGKPRKQTASTPGQLKESDLQSIRRNILDSVMDNIARMRADQVLEKWLKDITDRTFGGLSERLDQEAEQVLQGLQDTLTQIQIDLANSESKRMESMSRLKETQEELIAVLTSIKPIKDKLDAVMAQPMEAY